MERAEAERGAVWSREEKLETHRVIAASDFP